MQVRLTASQFARFAGIPQGSLGYYIAAGLLKPSIRRAASPGQPHIFGFVDVVIARAIAQLRLAAIPVAGTQAMARFWRSKSGRLVLNRISEQVRMREDGTWENTTVEKVFLVLSDGRAVAEPNCPVLELTRRHQCAVIHVVDAGLLVEQTTIDLTEAKMRLEFIEPSEGGRVPRERMRSLRTGPRDEARTHGGHEKVGRPRRT